MSIQSFIYDALNTHAPELATKLHQLEHAPPFSYSEFLQTGPYQPTDSGLSVQRGYWIINSDKPDLIDAVANSALNENLTVGHTTIPVTATDIETIEPVEETVYRTLSPVCVSHYVDENRIYLEPQDTMWGARIYKNVRERMKNTCGLPDNFKFSIDEIHWWKPKSLQVASEAYVPSARFEATIRADEKTSKFIQKQGLGERTGMGFGCIMPKSETPDDWRA
nr:CRISPR-associated endoribonuclease Cas6 [Natronococcus jeotgali]